MTMAPSAAVDNVQAQSIVRGYLFGKSGDDMCNMLDGVNHIFSTPQKSTDIGKKYLKFVICCELIVVKLRKAMLKIPTHNKQY